MDAKTEMFNKAASISKEVEAGKEKKEKELVVAKNSLEAIRANKQLQEMYQKNAGLGSENLASSIPTLKVHTSGKSKCELADGSEPKNGSFFLSSTKEQIDAPECHILTISRGYRTDGMNGKKNVYHQLMAGVVVNGGNVRPFYMYFNGLRLSKLWAFGKTASQYTKSKEFPLPLFALRVKLTTVKEDNDYGYSHLVNFEIMKDEEGSPLLITDVGLFTALKVGIEKAEMTIAQIIDAKETGEQEESVPVAEGAEPKTIMVDKQTDETVNPDDIPF